MTKAKQSKSTRKILSELNTSQINISSIRQSLTEENLVKMYGPPLILGAQTELRIPRVGTTCKHYIIQNYKASISDPSFCSLSQIITNPKKKNQGSSGYN
ncbi:hypothetical protein BB560_002837 [Smittium megazygosporum]|uniref:Uncharacterized protein n=1 Tax=Smittium megazygosporum TaxID=133381 RepID=A0A2T9ZDT7_9FUNG|nr:hypothetical protein BB560_002837 [Smittium megazygosporum]